MNKLLILIFLLSSCANFKQRQKETSLQNKIIAKISKKKEKMQNCAENTKLFTKLNQARVRVELRLLIDITGELQSYSIDDQEYPVEFSKCIFGIVKKIKFPKLEDNEVVEILQPIVFYQE